MVLFSVKSTQYLLNNGLVLWILKIKSDQFRPSLQLPEISQYGKWKPPTANLNKGLKWDFRWNFLGFIYSFFKMKPDEITIKWYLMHEIKT